MNPISRVVLLIALALSTNSALAQKYPDKPVRLVLGFAPGGGTDLLARLIAQKLTEYWGTAVVVENRAGAGGTIAAAYIADSNPDGYTILLGSVNQNAIAPNFYPNLHYNVSTSFSPIIYAGYSPLVLTVNPSLPVRSVQELVALAKAHPGQISAAAAGGVGTTEDLAITMFTSATDTQLIHVPYKGSGLSTNDLMAGQVKMAFDVLPPTIPLIRQGKLRALGITTLKRSSKAPDLPTLDESGLKGFEIVNWYGLFAPAKTPQAIIAKINAEVNKVLQDPAVSKKLADVGTEIGGGTPASFASYVDEEIKKFATIAKERGLKPEK